MAFTSSSLLACRRPFRTSRTVILAQSVVRWRPSTGEDLPIGGRKSSTNELAGPCRNRSQYGHHEHGIHADPPTAPRPGRPGNKRRVAHRPGMNGEVTGSCSPWATNRSISSDEAHPVIDRVDHRPAEFAEQAMCADGPGAIEFCPGIDWQRRSLIEPDKHRVP